MEIARLTTKGQISIPVAIRKKLNIKEGDKVLFLEEENGRIYFENAALMAFNHIQDAMAGEAQKAGFNTEQELQDYMREIRKETWERDYARDG